MNENNCWYCEKNQAVTTESYPKPYIEARFLKFFPDGKSKEYEFKIPRCVDCARVHIKHALPFKKAIQWSVAIFFISLVLLGMQEIFVFIDDMSLVLGAALPSVVILIGTLLTQRIRSERNYKGIKKVKDIDEYPPVLAAQENMTLMPIIEPLTEQQKISILKPKKLREGKERKLSDSILIWRDRLGLSLGMFFGGVLLAGFGALFFSLTETIGPEGAVMIGGSGGIAFLPIGGAIIDYLFLLIFGLMVVAGYGMVLVGAVIGLASIFMAVYHFIRSVISRK